MASKPADGFNVKILPVLGFLSLFLLQCVVASDSLLLLFVNADPGALGVSGEGSENRRRGQPWFEMKPGVQL